MMKEDKKTTMPRNDCIDFNIYPDKSQTNLRAVYDKEEPLFLYPHRDSNLDPMPINRHCEAFAILIIKAPESQDFSALPVTPERPGYIVVTKWFSEYCNAAISVVHELHTTLFQCSYPLFRLGNTKLMLFSRFSSIYGVKNAY